MSILNPYVLIALVLAFAGMGVVSYDKGRDDEHDKQQLEIAALNAQARQAEQSMSKVAQTYGETLRKAQNVAKAKETKLRHDIATGERRLFIPVKTEPLNCPSAVPAASDPAPAARSDGGETRAELDREVAETLIAIASEGDAAISKLNTCIQAYESIRSPK